VVDEVDFVLQRKVGTVGVSGRIGQVQGMDDFIGYIGEERVAILPGDRGHQGNPGGEIGEVEVLRFAGDFSPKLQRPTVTSVR
jgi:hypothetical protein